MSPGPVGATPAERYSSLRPRCSLVSRERHEGMMATAPPARRFLLLEVPGAWELPDALAASGLSPKVAAAVRDASAAAGARLLLIRRAGRHPALPAGAPRLWGLVTLEPHGPGQPGAPPGAGVVRWGEWAAETDLLGIDWTASGGSRGGSASAGRPVALVCTHGRHDVCCAVEGRPVALTAADDPRAEVWECSHTGGDRFAANVLWLPGGQMFGGLTVTNVGAFLDRVHEGRVPLEHYRGRCGDPHAEQAVQWHALHALGEDRPERLVIATTRTVAATAATGAEAHVVAEVVHAGRRHRLELAMHWSVLQQMSCHNPGAGRVRGYEPLSFEPV